MNLNQITILVLNVERATKFYEKPGFSLIVKSLPDCAVFHCTDGDSTFSSYKVEKLPTGEGIWIYFEEEDLENKVHQLIDQGIVFEQLPVDESGFGKKQNSKI